MAPDDRWQNRIVGEGEEVPDQLLANPLNWRIHPKHQQEALGAVLDEVGWVQRVIVNQRTGHLIDGHLRVTLALRRDEPVIPVEYVDLSEEEERLILATLDPLAGLAVTDPEVLGDLLEQTETESADLQQLLDDMAADEQTALSSLMAGMLGEKPAARQLGDSQKQIRPVLYVDELHTFEEAISLTANVNRGEAVLEICQFYLDHHAEG